MDDYRKPYKKKISEEEKKLLAELLYEFKSIIESKKTDQVWNTKKAETWEVISKKFNSVCTGPKRTGRELRVIYNNFKSILRKDIAEDKKKELLENPNMEQKSKNNPFLPMVEKPPKKVEENPTIGIVQVSEIIKNEDMISVSTKMDTDDTDDSSDDETESILFENLTNDRPKLIRTQTGATEPTLLALQKEDLSVQIELNKIKIKYYTTKIKFMEQQNSK